MIAVHLCKTVYQFFDSIHNQSCRARLGNGPYIYFFLYYKGLKWKFLYYQDIASIGDLRRGSLSEQYNVCETPGCKCNATLPEKHGPYYQLSFTEKGRSSTKSVNSKCVRKAKMQVKNYSRLRKLVEK